jgi:hypothetical protein
VDPKSIVCEFFRHGQCTKGFKCKFSHDLSVERKTAKIDLFTDRRDGGEGEEGEGGGMDDWDQEQLEKVGVLHVCCVCEREERGDRRAVCVRLTW